MTHKIAIAQVLKELGGEADKGVIEKRVVELKGGYHDTVARRMREMEAEGELSIVPHSGKGTRYKLNPDAFGGPSQRSEGGVGNRLANKVNERLNRKELSLFD